MSAIILRIIIYAAIAWFIYASARRIWRDATKPFRAAPPPQAAPDLKQRPGPEVIELKRDADGVFRPPGKEGR
ncbi:MAG: hypothetical protein P4M09_27060 [Devosia sp.]|nr:hypothetical protein [Devosia sp.]